MSLKYISGALISIPLLPLMYYQGKQIRASVPKLPEAKGSHGLYKAKGDTKGSLNIISIGESTFAGVGVETHEEGFTGTFAKELSAYFNIDVSWKVYARSGYTANRVVKKILPKITKQEQEADLILIGLGGNDAFTLNSPSKWKNDIRTMIDSLRENYPETLIVFCNMPPIKEFPAFTPLIKFTIGNLVEILGEELGKVANEYENVFYFGEKITLKSWIEKFDLTNKKEDFFSDGVHPSKLTYQTWAADTAKKIYSNEEIRPRLLNTI